MIIFISGTGTDVGKSFVNMELNGLLMSRGFNIISIKPIETGIKSNSSLTQSLRELEKSAFDRRLALSQADFPTQPTNLTQDTRIANDLKDSNESSLRGESSEASATKQSTLNRHTERSEVSKTRESNKNDESMTKKRINELDSALQHCDSYNFDSRVLDSSLRTSASLRMTENESDAQLHAQNQSVPKKINEICFYQFALPAAPFVADSQGIIDLDFLKNKIKALEKECDILLVEGAGGLFVPIKKDYFFIDLISDLGRESCDSRDSIDSPKSNSPKSKLLCLLISHDKLGCIDAILSHREALERRNIEFISIVNVFDEAKFMQISHPFLRNLKRNFTFQHQKREILEFILHFMKS